MTSLVASISLMLMMGKPNKLRLYSLPGCPNSVVEICCMHDAFNYSQLKTIVSSVKFSLEIKKQSLFLWHT